MNEETTNNGVEETRVKEDSNALPKDWVNVKDHPKELVIGKIDDGMKTKRALNEFQSNFSYISIVEPKNNKEALEDECWVQAMQAKLNEFKRQHVWNWFLYQEKK